MRYPVVNVPRRLRGRPEDYAKNVSDFKSLLSKVSQQAYVPPSGSGGPGGSYESYANMRMTPDAFEPPPDSEWTRDTAHEVYKMMYPSPEGQVSAPVSTAPPAPPAKPPPPKPEEVRPDVATEDGGTNLMTQDTAQKVYEMMYPPIPEPAPVPPASCDSGYTRSLAPPFGCLKDVSSTDETGMGDCPEGQFRPSAGAPCRGSVEMPGGYGDVATGGGGSGGSSTPFTMGRISTKPLMRGRF